MERARRWFILALASLLSSMGFSQRRRTQAVISRLSYVGDGLTAIASLTATYRPSTKPDRWLVNWGDGHEQEGPGRPPSELSHAYLVPGDFGIRFAIWDSSGGYSETIMPASIRIRNSNADPVSGPPSDEYDYYCQGGGYAGTATVRTVSAFTSTGVWDQVNAASNGDIICLPAGTYTFTQAVGNLANDLFFLGAGVGNTVLNPWPSGISSFFYMGTENVNRGNFRISGMTMNGGNGGGTTDSYIGIATSGLTTPANGRHRIDHIHFNNPSGFTTAVKHTLGAVFGVIDHCTVDQFGGLAFHHQMGLASETYAGNMIAQIPTGFGTDKFVFYENNTITMHNQASTMFVITSTAGGGRPVARYNDFYGSIEFYSHWTTGAELRMTAGEFYNNTWHFRPGDLRPGDGLARFESGTWLFYNNASLSCPDPPFITIDDRRSVPGDPNVTNPFGYCDGTKAWDGNAGDPSAPGWPCLGQIGRGWTTSTSVDNLVAGTVEQPSEPAYLWNNGEQAGCATGGACTDSIFAFATPAAYIKKTAHPNGEVDFSEGVAKPGYTAYTYPHPKTTALWP